jgi:hypothetical protein
VFCLKLYLLKIINSYCQSLQSIVPVRSLVVVSSLVVVVFALAFVPVVSAPVVSASLVPVVALASVEILLLSWNLLSRYLSSLIQPEFANPLAL